MVDNRFDVLVVGGGLVGAAFAVGLAQHPVAAGLSIGVVETAPFKGDPGGEAFDPRVVALAEKSRRQLQGLAVWSDALASRACSYHHMVVRDSAGTGCIEFDAADVHKTDLGCIVENAALLAALHQRIESLDNLSFVYSAVRRIRRTNADRGDLVLTLSDDRQLTASLVVAADGARSRIREQCGFTLSQRDYGHSAIVTTLTCERHHDHTARQWFMAEGPLAFLPLASADGHHVSIVWSQNHGEAKRLMALDEDRFCREVSLASEFALGNVVATARRFMIPLNERHAADYVQPGVALVGDAAHTIHPLAGQGVNLGFADVEVLVEELVRGLSRGLPVGHLSVLKRYQRRRKPANLAMMAAMEGFKRLFEEPRPVIRLVRNQGLSALNSLTPVKSRLIRQAMGF
ncbi:MAG: 2-octaprenyl-3-methyl-6-methoxy-1,4-benzoquinol hydroxylase [Porticoccaceae bacterium]|nr:2-octaprenyl-3-methyl-6-methoxy-1,4-benzoquinol hydroxylase [Porticoccaceae bacterium]